MIISYYYIAFIIIFVYLLLLRGRTRRSETNHDIRYKQTKHSRLDLQLVNRKVFENADLNYCHTENENPKKNWCVCSTNNKEWNHNVEFSHLNPHCIYRTRDGRYYLDHFATYFDYWPKFLIESSKQLKNESFYVCWNSADANYPFKGFSYSFSNGFRDKDVFLPDGFTNVHIYGLFPNHDHPFMVDIENNDLFLNLSILSETTTFETRKDIFIWRGSAHRYRRMHECRTVETCDIRKELDIYEHELIGTRLGFVLFAQKYTDLIDASLSSITAAESTKPLFEILQSSFPDVLPLKPIHPLSYYTEYRYVIVLEGFGTAWRLPYHFYTRQCVLLQHGRAYEWYYPFLKPWFHYVPFQANLSDLLDNIIYLKKNPNIGKQIALNGREFFDEFLTLKASRKVALSLVKTLAKLQSTRNLSCFDEHVYYWPCSSHKGKHFQIEFYKEKFQKEFYQKKLYCE